MILNYKPWPTPAGENWDTPIVTDIDVQDLYNLDADIRKIRDAMAYPTPENCDWAFWNESTGQSYAYMVAAMLVGKGFTVTCTKKSIAEKVEKLVQVFNSKVNVAGETIYDYLRDEWFDNLVHGRSTWRILRTKEAQTGIDIARVDPLTLTEVEDRVRGYKMFIQRALAHTKQYDTADSFYENYDPLSPPIRIPVWVKIPREEQVILHSKHFHQAPVKSALKYMIYKLWILKFMRKYGEKHWAPLLIGLIGEAGKYVPRKKELKEISDKLKTVFEQIHNFSALTLPGYIKVESIQPAGGGKGGDIYVSYIDMLDRQIMFTFFGSMATRDASGRELGTQRGIREDQFMFLTGIQARRASTLSRFYANVLCKENGIHNCLPEDIHIEWTPLFFQPIDVLTQAVTNLADVEIIDWEEARDMIRTVVPNLPDRKGGKVITSLAIAKSKSEGTITAGGNTRASNPRDQARHSAVK